MGITDRIAGGGTLLGLVSTLAAGAAHSQELVNRLRCRPAGENLPSVGMYGLFFDNGRRLCVAAKEDGDGTLVPCLRIGWTFVGQVRADVERELGTPWRTLGAASYAYLVYRDSTGQRGAYYIVEYEQVGGEETALAIQLTGDPAPTNISFSCLQLGDPEADAWRQLGPPAATVPFDAREMEKRGLRWEYPDPISIEIVNGRVFSFRVWRPEDVPAKKRSLSLLRKP